MVIIRFMLPGGGGRMAAAGSTVKRDLVAGLSSTDTLTWGGGQVAIAHSTTAGANMCCMGDLLVMSCLVVDWSSHEGGLVQFIP